MDALPQNAVVHQARYASSAFEFCALNSVKRRHEIPDAIMQVSIAHKEQ